MPRIYRIMKPDEDNKPIVGRSSSALGVRVFAEKNDIEPENGQVVPDTGGMSVLPSLRDFPDSFLPRRLRHIREGARGSNSNNVWRMGEGAFEFAPVSPDLVLRPDALRDEAAKPDHGVVEPARTMPLEDYEEALAKTRDEWVVDETGD